MNTKRFVPDMRFRGSTLAIVFGTLTLLGAPAQLQQAGGAAVAGFISGPIMILGALAYRSRKRRLLGLRTETMLRRSVEALALAAIVLLIILRNDIVFEIATDSFPYVIVPGWAIVAYCCAGIRIKKEDPA